IIDACYTPDNEIKLKISRTMDNIGLSSIDFSLENNGKTRRWLCSDNCRNCQILQVGETKFYYLSVNEPINNAAVTLSAGECVIERKEITNPCPD
ncbi:MAG: hypothetical protein MUF61_03400, partial [archaeon]|nr:hypothetical protein [archaeon]